ncbi:MAG: ABC transporter permease subunit, partial [Anaerolineae bacterium]|nr:ABC transporter permease subunit [Anaerolineae bacterium]
DGTVRLWQTAIGRHLRLLEEHDKAVNAVIFHPQEEMFLTADASGIAYLWETEKAEKTDPDIPVVTYDNYKVAITDAAFNPEGDLVLTGDESGTAKLWATLTGDVVSTFSQDAAINAVAYSPDGTTIATGHADGNVYLWDVDSGDVLTTIAGHDNAVNAVSFSPDGATIVTAGADNTAQLWSIDGENLQTFTGHTDAVNSAVFSSDGMSVLTSSSDGTTLLWDIESGEITRTFDELNYPVHTALISPDEKTVVTGTEGRRRFYLLGTDGAGRDLATRLLVGGQVSLKIGFFSAIGSLSIGVVLGIAAGYWRGPFDDVVMWVITTLNSIPQLFLLLIISATLAPNDTSLILVLVFLGWTGATRLVRGETFSLREREFVMAARAVGASPLRIMFTHISPNVLSVLLIVLSRGIGNLILAESSLSFLGFGVKPPTPTWGNMLTGGLELLRNAPHLVFAPGLLISITVLCLYVIGDGLRDAFDPKLSG